MPQLPIILEGAGWRASFHACGDRIAHTIGVSVGSRFVPLLASMEGTPDDDWPPSPPLTTIDVPAGSPSSAALLVGMAGRSHWSLSVELDAQARRITFDAAVRLKELPARLGSAYRTMVAARADAGGADAGGALILAVDGLAMRVEATVFTDQPPGTPTAKLRATDDGLAIWLEPAGLRLPCTVRWGYTITRIDESA